MQQQWPTAAKNKLIKLDNEQKNLKKHSISLVIREMQIKEISHPLEKLSFFFKDWLLAVEQLEILHISGCNFLQS